MSLEGAVIVSLVIANSVWIIWAMHLRKEIQRLRAERLQRGGWNWKQHKQFGHN